MDTKVFEVWLVHCSFDFLRDTPYNLHPNERDLSLKCIEKERDVWVQAVTCDVHIQLPFNHLIELHSGITFAYTCILSLSQSNVNPPLLAVRCGWVVIKCRVKQQQKGVSLCFSFNKYKSHQSLIKLQFWPIWLINRFILFTWSGPRALWQLLPAIHLLSEGEDAHWSGHWWAWLQAWRFGR